MDLSIFGKIGTVFKYAISSFMGIEIFIICFLLFLILFFNIKKNNKIYTIVISVILPFLLFIILMGYHEYTYQCFTALFKYIMNYIYFPSTIAYFFIMLFVIVLLLYTLMSKKMSNFKKIINYSMFCLMLFLYMLFLSLEISNSINLADKALLYENNIILSIIQISNFILVIWGLFTIFYNLYLYFKKRFD